MQARFRLGTVIKSLLTTTCGAAMLITAAAVLDPATLRAGSIESSRSTSADDARQEFVRSLSSFISQCESVVAVRTSEPDGSTEIVLWSEDAHDAGHINADELAVVRHSPLFQTVTVYSMAGSEALRSESRARALNARASELGTPRLGAAEIAAPGFLDHWRAQGGVQARVVATGISDMRVEGAVKPTQRGAGGAAALRLHFRWDGESADGAGAVHSIVEVGPHRAQATESKP